jgi:cyclopropane fatty-acyl-phospholipid synthase-like methyltransferase
MKTWWLDEIAHAGPEHLDAEYVAGYEAKAGFDPGPDIAELQRHGLDQTSTVIDLGAGTGAFSTAIAAHCRHVIAVDVSPAMNDILIRRVAALGLDNVTVVHSGLLSYEHDGSPADFVFSRNVFHHLPDFWKSVALDRTIGLLGSGGIARIHDLIYDFDPTEIEVMMTEWFAGAVDDPSVGFTAGELAEHVRTEFSTYRWVFEGMLERAGFDILDRAFVRRIYGAYTCRRR